MISLIPVNKVGYFYKVEEEAREVLTKFREKDTILE